MYRFSYIDLALVSGLNRLLLGRGLFLLSTDLSSGYLRLVEEEVVVVAILFLLNWFCRVGVSLIKVG